MVVKRIELFDPNATTLSFRSPISQSWIAQIMHFSIGFNAFIRGLFNALHPICTDLYTNMQNILGKNDQKHIHFNENWMIRLVQMGERKDRVVV